jgi:hypothetical protein
LKPAWEKICKTLSQALNWVWWHTSAMPAM